MIVAEKLGRLASFSVDQTTGRIVEWVSASMVIDIRGTMSVKNDRFPGLDVDVEMDTKGVWPCQSL